jgi:predicted SAM-dependent methyltransferase
MKQERIPSGEGIKIVIGTRTYLGPDWLHVDIDPFYLHATDGKCYDVDIVSDARNIPLPDNHADIIYSSECLEHFPWGEYKGALKEWCRILKPGGMIRVEVPDFLNACKKLLALNSLEGDRAMQQIFFAGQTNQYDFHYVGLTSRMLIDDFENLGLEIIDVVEADEFGLLKVDAAKSVVEQDYILKVDARKL